MLAGVVIGPKIFYALRLCYRLILSCNMIRHKVDNYFHAYAMGAFYKGLKFGHT